MLIADVPPVVVAQAPESGMRTIGFMATGSPADVDRLQKLATAQGFRSGQLQAPGGRRKLMVGFPLTGDNRKGLTLLQQVQAKRFGNFLVERMEAPVSAIRQKTRG